MMSKELSKFAVGSEGLELSDSARQRLLEESQRLIHHGNLKEWQALLMKAAGLWNIKTKKLHLAANCDSFDDYGATIGMSERQRRNYERIGQRMFESAFAHAQAAKEPINPITFVFTQKIIADVFEGFFTNGHIVTMRSLAAASANLTTFQAYLRGEEIEDKRAIKLLMDSNEISDKRLESKEQKTLTDKEKERDFHERMRTVAQAHGFKWDRVACRFTQVDGTPLTEEQQAELILPTDAMRMWRDVYKEVRMTTQRIASLANVGFKQFELFSRIPNTKFQQEVDDIAAGIDTQINNLLLLKDALLARDIERVQEIAKHSEEG